MVTELNKVRLGFAKGRNDFEFEIEKPRAIPRAIVNAGLAIDAVKKDIKDGVQIAGMGVYALLKPISEEAGQEGIIANTKKKTAQIGVAFLSRILTPESLMLGDVMSDAIGDMEGLLNLKKEIEEDREKTFKEVRKENHPLCVAAEDGQLDIVQSLLKIAKSLNAEGIKKDFNESLYLAAKNGNGGVVQALLKAGAQVNGPEFGIKGPDLEGSDLEGSDLEVIDQSEDFRVNDTPLCIAARNGHVHVVELLLKAGADLNSIDVNDGNTPLMIAAKYDQLKVLEVLLAAGAETSYEVDGYPPKSAIELAKSRRNIEIVRVLTENTWMATVKTWAWIAKVAIRPLSTS